MIPEAEIHPLASRELEEATLFYDRRVKGLGQRFLRAVEEAIEHILLFPEASPLVAKTVRKKVVGNFPFSIFYSLEKSSIHFVAVGHQKKEPMYWLDRL